jgi:hypothetical protein
MPEPTTTQKVAAGRAGWRTVRHYAYVERPYDALWAKLVEVPRQVLGDGGPDGGAAVSELRIHRAGIDLSRTVKIKFGGLVVEDEMARMGICWEDGRHRQLFPVLEGILSLNPVPSGRRPATQVGLVGRYRPPFGALGEVGDRMAGEEVADDAVAGFVHDVVHRLEALVPAEEVDPVTAEPQGEIDTAGHRRIHVQLDGLGSRPGGAAGISRRLAGTPGVVRAEVDPFVALAEVEYDPDRCSLSRILAGLEVDPS